MFTPLMVLGDGIKIDIGDIHWTLTLALLVYLLVAAIIGVIAEFIVGWKLPFGIIGAIVAALVGIWLFTDVIKVIIPGDLVYYGVPLFTALLGAIVLVALWHLVTYRGWHRRRRYYYRRSS